MGMPILHCGYGHWHLLPNASFRLYPTKGLEESSIMPFLNLERPQRIVPGYGPKTAKIAIIGEAPGAYEDIRLKPFMGPAGGVLEQCMHAAGIIRSEVYLTNVVKVKPPGNDISPYFNSKTGVFTEEGMEWVGKLGVELNSIDANILVACGACAFAALSIGANPKASVAASHRSGMHQITKYRGYLFESSLLPDRRKFVPTLHPAAALRGMYRYRHLIAADLKKAREQSLVRELVRPARQLVYEFGHVNEVLEWLDYYAQQPIVCFDIEVLNYEVSCIGFSSSPDIACSIPFNKSWSEWEELQIWRGVQRVLGNPNSVKVAQNGIFDAHFLLTKCGVEVRGPIHDTMVGHSIMFPELRKGLDFLGSIYCGSQVYWKDMVQFDNIKEES